MMPEHHFRKPGDVAHHLGISPSTLRRWSTQFAAYLSPPAGESERSEAGGHVHRRYSDEDVATLMMIKSLLMEGQSYEQVRDRLELLRKEEQAERASEPATLLPAPLPAVTFLSEAMHTVADGQQLLLNSQQATRELLNLVVQDNFNLKEENARLRERMMRLEQELSENRRREEARREMLERRLERLEELAYRPTSSETSSTSEGDAPMERRRGCLARLFGL